MSIDFSSLSGQPRLLIEATLKPVQGRVFSRRAFRISATLLMRPLTDPGRWFSSKVPRAWPIASKRSAGTR